MHKSRMKILTVSCGLALAGGCASLNHTSPPQFAVAPVTNVTHSAAVADANYQIGRYYQGRLQYEAAIAAYRKSLEANPDNAEAHNALGVIYASQGKYKQAVSELRAALALTPAAAHVRNNLGYTYLLDGQNAEALASLNAALGLDPNDQRVRDNIEIVEKRLAQEAPNRSGVQVAAAGGAEFESLPTEQTDNGSPVVVAKPAPITTPPPAKEHTVTLASVPATAMRTLEGIQVSTSAQSRMEMVQVSPNVYEARVRVPIEKPSAALQDKAHGYGDTGQVAVTKFRMEVSNGNGVTGLARRVSHLLASKGMPAARLTNQKPYRQAYTEIQYRPGFLVDATSLGRNINYMASMIESSGLKAGTDVRLVLGKDEATNLAILQALEGQVLLAMK